MSSDKWVMMRKDEETGGRSFIQCAPTPELASSYHGSPKLDGLPKSSVLVENSERPVMRGVSF